MIYLQYGVILGYAFQLFVPFVWVKSHFVARIFNRNLKWEVYLLTCLKIFLKCYVVFVVYILPLACKTMKVDVNSCIFR